MTGTAVDVPAQGAPQASSTKNEQPGMPVLNMTSILAGTERVSRDKLGPPGDSRTRRASGVVQEEVERINNLTAKKKVMKTNSTVKQMVAVMDDKAKLAMAQVTPARKYKQGKRVLKREIEMGIQPRILGFLSDVDQRGPLPGGQDGLGGVVAVRQALLEKEVVRILMLRATVILRRKEENCNTISY